MRGVLSRKFVLNQPPCQQRILGDSTECASKTCQTRVREVGMHPQTGWDLLWGEHVKSLTTFPHACHRLVCSEARAGPQAESWGLALKAVRSACGNGEGYGALRTSAAKDM